MTVFVALREPCAASVAGSRRDLFDSADQELAPGIRTGQARYARALYDNPVYAVLFFQAKKVIALESFPTFLSVELIGPGDSERREHAGGAAVLHGVGERTALRDGAETVLVFSLQSHVARIKNEIGVLWRVVAHPLEGLYPNIFRLPARKFEMRGRGSKTVLRISHSRAERNEKKNPAPERFLEEKLADEPTSKKEHHHVEEVQKAEWLDFGKIFLARDECRHRREQGSVDCQGLAKQPHGSEAVAARKPDESDQNGEWGEKAEPFIPGPIAEEKIGAHLENGVILRGDRGKQGLGGV